MPTKLLTVAIFMVAIGFVRSAASSSGSATANLGSSDPAAPVITAVELRPAKTLLVQPCPVMLVFHGEITTTRATSVTYTWVDSRGKTWPVHHRRFSLPGVN